VTHTDSAAGAKETEKENIILRYAFILYQAMFLQHAIQSVTDEGSLGSSNKWQE
jgi:hypothetical protein